MQISHSDGNLTPNLAHETCPLTNWHLDRLVELVFSDFVKMLLMAFRSNDINCVYVDFHRRAYNRTYCVIRDASLILY